MTVMHEHATGDGWRRLGVLFLGVVTIGLPINTISDYALLAILALIVFNSEVSTRPGAWLAAGGIVAVAVVGQLWLSPERIEEGHNVFLPSAALERGLPGDVYRYMAVEFDAQYPPAQRCDPKKFGCWQNNGPPDSTFAFSADGIWRKSGFSRQVITIDFSDPVWLRPGFINEMRYNWTADSDVQRGKRDRRFWMGWHRWQLTMPWFETIRLPAAYAGGELCWRGTLMWEDESGRFAPLANGCRTIQALDAGKRIFGVAVKPDTLAMHLRPPWTGALAIFARGILVLIAAAGIVVMLVRVRAERLLVPATILALSVLVIAVDDASFLGGVRPFDGGDDGLFYDGMGRLILQKLLTGDVAGFLEGGEKVFYYGGPGLRYFRAIEHIVFGESYFGYLSVVLVFPFLVQSLFRRFLPADWSLALIFIFVGVPVGVLFGTSFVQYQQLASRGFADPAAYIFFVAGMLPIITGQSDRHIKFAPAFFGALLLALGVSMKPIVAPAAAVLIGGAGFAALYLRQWRRLVGLGVGFAPVFWMALHNWLFGHVFVLFSANAGHPDVLVMPPSAYADAARELVSLDFGGAHVRQWATNLLWWLTGPSAVPWRPYAPLVLVLVAVHAGAIAALVYVVGWGREFDHWLRLVGASALAQHVVAMFYNAATPRYHFLSWFLTMLVVTVWVQRVGLEQVRRRYPGWFERFVAHPWSRRLASDLARLQKLSA